MYEYLIGIAILAIIWAIFYFVRKDLRKPMIWSGLVYVFISAGFFFIFFKIISQFIYLGEGFIPGYWNPDTLFDLGRTLGLSIEDLFFAFFVGGIATVIYEAIFRKKISIRRSYHPHLRAIVVGLGAAGILMLFMRPNPIYPLILFGFVGALVLCIERKDLIMHSIFGGIGFLLVYMAGFILFLILFPDYFERVYNLKALSGISFIGFPIEELLYAFSFGLLWAP